MTDKPAEGRVHEQPNPDGTKSNYDDVGDKVKKSDKGDWVKDNSPDATKSTDKSPETTPGKVPETSK